MTNNALITLNNGSTMDVEFTASKFLPPTDELPGKFVFYNGDTRVLTIDEGQVYHIEAGPLEV